jgi:predicted nucleic acid-binding Zn ribbon protein
MRPEPDRVRLAAEALARARADAWARGDRPQAGNILTGHGVPKEDSSERTGVTADSQLPPSWSARPHREDPQPLTAAVDGLLSTRGWQQRAAVGGIFGKWPEIVGLQLAAHTQPDSFDDGELTLSADSDAWAAQLRLLTPQLLNRLADELGAGTVSRINVRGPSRHRPDRATREKRAPR